MIVSFPCQTGSSEPSSSLFGSPLSHPSSSIHSSNLISFPSQPLLLSPHLIHNHHFLPLLLHPSSFFLLVLPSGLLFFSAFVTSCDVTFHQLFFPFLLLLFSILASITFLSPPFLPSSSLTLNFSFPLSLDHQLTLTLATFQSLIVRRE